MPRNLHRGQRAMSGLEAALILDTFSTTVGILPSKVATYHPENAARSAYSRYESQIG